MSLLQVAHIAGCYYVSPRVDVTHEPAYPGDRAEFDVVEWQLWAGAEQDARGQWTCDWVEDYETETEAVAAAYRLAELDASDVPHVSAHTP